MPASGGHTASGGLAADAKPLLQAAVPPQGAVQKQFWRCPKQFQRSCGRKWGIRQGGNAKTGPTLSVALKSSPGLLLSRDMPWIQSSQMYTAFERRGLPPAPRGDKPQPAGEAALKTYGETNHLITHPVGRIRADRAQHTPYVLKSRGLKLPRGIGRHMHGCVAPATPHATASTRFLRLQRRERLSLVQNTAFEQEFRPTVLLQQRSAPALHVLTLLHRCISRCAGRSSDPIADAAFCCCYARMPRDGTFASDAAVQTYQ